MLSSWATRQGNCSYEWPERVKGEADVWIEQAGEDSVGANARSRANQAWQAASQRLRRLGASSSLAVAASISTRWPG